MRKKTGIGLAVSAAGMLCFASTTTAAVAPYFEDFDDGASELQFYKYTPTDSTWTHEDGKLKHSSINPGSGAQQFAGALTKVTGLAAPTSWKVEATVSISNLETSWPASVATVGLAGMAKNTNVGQWNSDSLYYAGEWVLAGDNVRSLRIRYGRGNNSQGAYIGSGVVTFPEDVQLDTEYTLALIGTYDTEGNLTLSFSVSDGVNEAVATMTEPIAADQVMTGEYFGIRAYNDNYRKLEASWDNLSVTVVPEPVSLSLVGLVGATVLARRRRA